VERIAGYYGENRDAAGRVGISVRSVGISLRDSAGYHERSKRSASEYIVSWSQTLYCGAMYGRVAAK